MKRLAALVAATLAIVTTALPAAAAQFVQDGAGMFSAGTVASLEQKIGAFNAQTGKEIVVVTVPSLNGETRQQAAQTVFSEQRINGILIFVAKAERQDIIVPGARTAQFFPASTTAQIRQAMEAQFKNGDFDGGITTAVDQTLDVFRSHLNSLPSNTQPRNYPAPSYQRPAAVSNGVHFPVILWIVIIIVGFLIIRSIFRAMSGPRSYGGGPGVPGGPGYGPGPGYGGPGYYGGGGGGFWSGLLGGLGGAWLGNELFGGNRGGTEIIQQQGGDTGGAWGGGGNAPDPGGWGNDAGQADMGSSSGGDWGGGGFGGGDFGGGGGGGFGGGDSGGGGGDSGGGW